LPKKDTTKDDFKTFAEKLISRAKDYEASSPPLGRAAIEAISQINLLENMIRESVAKPKATAEVPPVNSPVPQASKLPASTLGRMRAEYRPALQDELILSALMEFQKNTQAVASSHQSKPAQSFAPHSPPKVDTQLKSKTSVRVPVSHSVLQTKR